MYVYIVAFTGYKCTHTEHDSYTSTHISGTRGMMSDVGICKYVCECAFVYDWVHPSTHYMCCISKNVMIWIIKYNVFVLRVHILDDKSSFWINIHITQKSAVVYVFVFIFFPFLLFYSIILFLNMADDVLKDPTACSGGLMPVGCYLQCWLNSFICWNTNWVVGNKRGFWFMSPVLADFLNISNSESQCIFYQSVVWIGCAITVNEWYSS